MTARSADSGAGARRTAGTQSWRRRRDARGRRQSRGEAPRVRRGEPGREGHRQVTDAGQAGERPRPPPGEGDARSWLTKAQTWGGGGSLRVLTQGRRTVTMPPPGTEAARGGADREALAPPGRPHSVTRRWARITRECVSVTCELHGARPRKSKRSVSDVPRRGGTPEHTTHSSKTTDVRQGAEAGSGSGERGRRAQKATDAAA